MMLALTVMELGHCHPALAAAVTEAVTLATTNASNSTAASDCSSRDGEAAGAQFPP